MGIAHSQSLFESINIVVIGLVMVVIDNNKLKQKALEIGFHLVGIVSVDKYLQDDSLNRQRLQSWLNQGYHADLEWMKSPKRQDIREYMGNVRSLICVAINYYTPHQHSNLPDRGKISRYAWGRDYHKIMQTKLKTLANWLKQEVENIDLKCSVDTAPIQDKVWAERAGIGWIGKHSNVISRNYGSWLFLGEILTNIELKSDQFHPNHCGTCTRCLSACPTQAIVKPFVVDANRCIAYHTIENRQPRLPSEIASKLNGWVAGCDICQDVCPWNKRFAQVTDIADFNPYSGNLEPKLTDLTQLSETQWDQRFRASALRRIKPAMWRRNAQANCNN